MDLKSLNLKELNYCIKNLPTDLVFEILKQFDLLTFIRICDTLKINLDDKIKFIMQNYGFIEFLYLDNQNIINLRKNKIINSDQLHLISSNYIIDNDNNESKNIVNLINEKMISMDNLIILINSLNAKEIQEIQAIKIELHKYNCVTNIKNLKQLKILYDFIIEYGIEVYWLIFNDNFNDDIKILKKFKTVNSIIFGAGFNQPICNRLKSEKKYLHDNIKCLSFSRDYNMPIFKQKASDEGYGVNYLPKNLKYLIFGESFNQSIFNSLDSDICHLPGSLEYLNLGGFFDEPIHNSHNNSILPPNLKTLIFGTKFNRPVCNLPYLKRYRGDIHYYREFSWPPPPQPDTFISYLPKNLTHLIFGDFFDQSINHPMCLPSTLTHLVLGHYFKSPINLIDGNITHLTIGANFYSENNKSADVFPKSVTHLGIGKHGDYHIRDLFIPSRITHINLLVGYCISLINDDFSSCLPSHITHLILNDHYYDNISSNILHLTITKMLF